MPLGPGANKFSEIAGEKNDHYAKAALPPIVFIFVCLSVRNP
jgi:hypothetical protein